MTDTIIYTEVFKRPVFPTSITHARIRIECFSQLMADKIFEAMREMKLNDPEIMTSKVFSWDTGENTDKYTIKAWYGVHQDYGQLIERLKGIVFNEQTA